MSEFEAIIFEKHGHLAYVTLNRPDLLNAYNITMRDELYEVLGAIRDDSEIRVVILKGAGEKAFCAGADLTEFLTAPPPVFARIARFERDIWKRFTEMPVPFIAAMHGFVLGSGIEIAFCCDIRLCSEDALFRLPEINLGLITAAGGSQTLSRNINRSHAFEILTSGRWLKAEEAKGMRLVNRVLPRQELFIEADKLATTIAKLNPASVIAVKQAIVRGLDLSLEEGLKLERRLGLSLL